MTTTTIMLLLLLQHLLLLQVSYGFPVTSSQSSKKNRFQPKRPKRKSGGGGFGGGNTAKKIEYTRDTSPKLLQLLEFLITQKSLGLDPSDGGAIEVGRTTGSDGRRGVFCTLPIKKKEIICQIPSDCGLALSDPANTEEENVSMVQAAHNFIKLYRQDPVRLQQWKSVLDMLPQSSTDDEEMTLTPDYYEEEELELLEFPPLLQQIKDRQKEMQQIIDDEEKSGGDLTYDELQFATHLVSSRSVAVPIADATEPMLDDEGRPVMKVGEEGKILRILIPFLDLVNHASVQNANCELHLIDPQKDDAWFALKAKRNIPAGAELSVSYGTTGFESSCDIFRDYGFVPNDHKPVDKLMLKKLHEQEPTAYPQWTTTLKEDTFMLKEGEDLGRLGAILQLRAALKRAEAENKDDTDKK